MDWITENYLPGTVVIKRPEYLLTVTAEVTPDHTRHEVLADRDTVQGALRSQHELNNMVEYRVYLGRNSMTYGRYLVFISV